VLLEHTKQAVSLREPVHLLSQLDLHSTFFHFDHRNNPELGKIATATTL
jgi:hypothetical protein